MFGIIFAMLGGAYWGGRLLYEDAVRSEKTRQDKERDANHRRMHEIFYPNTPEQVRLAGDLFHLSWHNLKELCDMVTDDLVVIWGEDWKHYHPCSTGFETAVYHLAMARNGMCKAIAIPFTPKVNWRRKDIAEYDIAFAKRLEEILVETTGVCVEYVSIMNERDVKTGKIDGLRSKCLVEYSPIKRRLW